MLLEAYEAAGPALVVLLAGLFGREFLVENDLFVGSAHRVWAHVDDVVAAFAHVQLDDQELHEGGRGVSSGMSEHTKSVYLEASAPCLLVADIHRAIRCWRDRFGFTSDHVWGNFTIMHRDGVHVMLREVPEGVEVVPNWKVADKMWDAYIWVTDARAMYAEMKERGATIDYELYETDYGVLEFGLQDVDGHDIGVGQVLEA